MYLDTVNYEHLAVSQETFLAHLAAAGIPEAHMELRRMREEADAAAALEAVAAMEVADAADAAAAGEAALEQEGPAQQQAQQAQQAAAASVARAAASGAAAAQARHEQQAAAAAAVAAVGGEDDVLAGLQLAEGEAAPSREGSESLGLEPAQTSFPTTPLGLAVPGEGEGLGSAAREGSLPALTPLGGGSQSPALLEPLTVGAEESEAAAGSSAPGDVHAAALAGGEEGQQVQRTQQAGSAAQRELSFEAAAETQAATAAATAEHERQQQAAQAAAAAAVAAAVASQPYEEPVLIEEIVAEGTRHVLAAEAAGQLQQRYPYMYARAEDLSVVSTGGGLCFDHGWLGWKACGPLARMPASHMSGTPAYEGCQGRAHAGTLMASPVTLPPSCLPPAQAEVEGVLLGYKELLLRYEALSRALQQQLGLLPGAPDGSNSTGSSPAGLSTSPGHRSKGQQAAQGFGSLVLTDAGTGHARRVASAPIAVAAPHGARAAGSAPGSADASPGGKWSPGGILQRISKGASAARRSITPPRDRGGGRAAVAAEAAVTAAEAGGRSLNNSRAASPAGKSGQPFFSTLFGSPKNAAAQQLTAEQQPAEQQPRAAAAADEQRGNPQPPAQQPQPAEQPQPTELEPHVGGAAAAPAGGSDEPTPELSFGGGLLSPADTPDAPSACEGVVAIEPAAAQHVTAAGAAAAAAAAAAADDRIDLLLGGEPVEEDPQPQQQVQDEAQQQQQQGDGTAGSSASDLIQLGASRGSSQQPLAAADAAAGPDLLLALGGAGEALPQPEGSDAQPDSSLI